jgi:hypothetical protein
MIGGKPARDIAEEFVAGADQLVRPVIGGAGWRCGGRILLTLRRRLAAAGWTCCGGGTAGLRRWQRLALLNLRELDLGQRRRNAAHQRGERRCG